MPAQPPAETLCKHEITRTEPFQCQRYCLNILYLCGLKGAFPGCPIFPSRAALSCVSTWHTGKGIPPAAQLAGALCISSQQQIPQCWPHQIPGLINSFLLYHPHLSHFSTQTVTWWLTLIMLRGGKWLRKCDDKRHLAVDYSLWTKPIPAPPICSALPKICTLGTSSTMEQFLALSKLQLKFKCVTGPEGTKTSSRRFVGAEILHCGNALLIFMQKRCPVGAGTSLGHPPWISTLFWEHTNLRLKCWVSIH